MTNWSGVVTRGRRAAWPRRSSPMARMKSPVVRAETPRVAGRLLRGVRDFADVAGAASVTRHVADEALTRLEIRPARPRRDGPGATSP